MNHLNRLCVRSPFPGALAQGRAGGGLVMAIDGGSTWSHPQSFRQRYDIPQSTSCSRTIRCDTRKENIDAVLLTIVS